METETIKHDEMRAGYETLKDDMQQLTDDFKEVIHTFGEKSKDRFVESRQKVGTAIKSWGERAKDRANNAYERISRRSKDAAEKSREKIALRPFTYVFAALATGMALGAFFNRR
jgi:ElaB/YqjD/DUF883 family membrane-anchored ribosome-binding protein